MCPAVARDGLKALPQGVDNPRVDVYGFSGVWWFGQAVSLRDHVKHRIDRRRGEYRMGKVFHSC